MRGAPSTKKRIQIIQKLYKLHLPDFLSSRFLAILSGVLWALPSKLDHSKSLQFLLLVVSAFFGNLLPGLPEDVERDAHAPDIDGRAKIAGRLAAHAHVQHAVEHSGSEILCGAEVHFLRVDLGVCPDELRFREVSKKNGRRRVDADHGGWLAPWETWSEGQEEGERGLTMAAANRGNPSRAFR